jgi:4-hydroxy-tetrahydrodipicolinate reductase
MDAPIQLLIHGATGRMGQALLRLAAEDPARFALAGAVSRKPEQRVVDGVPQFAAAELNGVPPFDVAVDFSQPEAFDAVLALCVARKAGFVSGTTGLSDTQRAALAEAAAAIPVLWAPNFSLGVAVLADAVARAAHALQGWDCDVVEAHHAGKRDAPSGTALALGEAAAGGGATPRYASLRAGDIVGEHTVQFAGAGERVEFIHRAASRDVFARGALHAARWLAGRPPGQYRMADLL